MFQIMFTICLNYNTNVTCDYVTSDRSLCVHGSNFVMYFLSFNCEKHDMSILKCITPYKKWLLKFMCKNVTEYSKMCRACKINLAMGNKTASEPPGWDETFLKICYIMKWL